VTHPYAGAAYIKIDETEISKASSLLDYIYGIDLSLLLSSMTAYRDETKCRI
jgi:hypothetical protein